MDRIRVWEGVRRVVNGHDDSNYEWIEFEGEQLGTWTEYVDDRDTRGVTYSIYRTAQGTIIVHISRWSRWANEADYGTVVEYDTVEEASRYYRRELENAGIIQRQVLTLDAWRAKQKDRKKGREESEPER